MAEQKQLATRVPPETFRALRILAAEQGTTVQALVNEALSDLLVKHGKQRKGVRKRG